MVRIIISNIRFLVRKLLNFQSLKDGSAQTTPLIGLQVPVNILAKPVDLNESAPKKKNATKKRPPAKNTG